jgi:hypothetical protein
MIDPDRTDTCARAHISITIRFTHFERAHNLIPLAFKIISLTFCSLLLSFALFDSHHCDLVSFVRCVKVNIATDLKLSDLDHTVE